MAHRGLGSNRTEKHPSIIYTSGRAILFTGRIAVNDANVATLQRLAIHEARKVDNLRNARDKAIASHAQEIKVLREGHGEEMVLQSREIFRLWKERAMKSKEISILKGKMHPVNQDHKGFEWGEYHQQVRFCAFERIASRKDLTPEERVKAM